MRKTRFLILMAFIGFFGLVATACGGSTTIATADPTAVPEPQPTSAPAPEPAPAEAPAEPTAVPEPDPTATPVPEPTAEPEPTATPEPVRGETLESFVGADLAPYSPDATLDGEVSVYWNNGSNGLLIAIYRDAGFADLTGPCSGNSIFTSPDFEYVTNTPAAPGACVEFPTPVSSVRVHTGNVWLYETQIPNDSVGTLFGSLEWNSDAGIVGFTSQAINSPGTPEINYDADVYTIAAMFTSDGSTEITCGPAMS